MAFEAAGARVKEFFSKESVVVAGGVATGIITCDMVSSWIVKQLGLKDTGALVGNGIVKVMFGAIFFTIGDRVASGAMKTFLHFVGIGSLVSIVLDIVKYALPGIASRGGIENFISTGNKGKNQIGQKININANETQKQNRQTNRQSSSSALINRL